MLCKVLGMQGFGDVGSALGYVRGNLRYVEGTFWVCHNPVRDLDLDLSLMRFSSLSLSLG